MILCCNIITQRSDIFVKIFKVNSNKVAFDEDESMIIIAKSKNRALEIALKK